MEDFRSLFGEDGKTTLDFEGFKSAVESKGMKLVDLEKGGYVAKGKYDKLAGDFTKYKSDNDVSKYSDYEEIKAQLEEYKTKEQMEALYKKVKDKDVDDKFVKFVTSEVSNMVTDTKTFDAALTEFLKDNTQYSKKNQKVFIAGSSVKLNGGSGEPQTTNEFMNNLLRGTRK